MLSEELANQIVKNSLPCFLRFVFLTFSLINSDFNGTSTPKLESDNKF